jgi:hypothetical protein
MKRIQALNNLREKVTNMYFRINDEKHLNYKDSIFVSYMYITIQQLMIEKEQIDNSYSKTYTRIKNSIFGRTKFPENENFVSDLYSNRTFNRIRKDVYKAGLEHSCEKRENVEKTIINTKKYVDSIYFNKYLKFSKKNSNYMKILSDRLYIIIDKMSNEQFEETFDINKCSVSYTI